VAAAYADGAFGPVPAKKQGARRGAGRAISDRAELELIRQRVSCIALIGRSVHLKRRGSLAIGLCPFHTERSASFHVWDDHYHCFGCGAHGGAFDWIMRAEDCGFARAVDMLRAEAGLAAGRPAVAARPIVRALPEDRERARRRKLEAARAIWAESLPARGTPAEAYLAGRGLAGWPIPPCIRFVPELRYELPEADGRTHRYLPAMVAVIQGADDFLIGVHRTYLRRRNDGQWVKASSVEGEPPLQAKLTAGFVMSGAVRLAPAGPRLLLGEGKETVASAMRAAGLPGWAALSLHNLCGRARRDVHGRPTGEPDPQWPGVVLPPIVREVILLADGDTKDLELLERCLALAARRYALQGRTVRIARPQGREDFNDMLCRLDAAAVDAQLRAAQEARGPEFTVGDLQDACTRAVVEGGLGRLAQVVP